MLWVSKGLRHPNATFDEELFWNLIAKVNFEPKDVVPLGSQQVRFSEAMNAQLWLMFIYDQRSFFRKLGRIKPIGSKIGFMGWLTSFVFVFRATIPIRIKVTWRKFKLSWNKWILSFSTNSETE